MSEKSFSGMRITRSCRDAFTDPGVGLLFIVSSHVGIRASELERITWDRVDFERKVIGLERGKTKNKEPRSAPIFGDMTEALQSAKQHRVEFYPESPWVFSRAGELLRDFRHEWSRAVQAAGVPELHFRDLRRTAQRLMRGAGIDKITRMRIMGHKTDATDVRYGGVADEDVIQAGARLQEAFETTLGGGTSRSDQTNTAQPPVTGAPAELLARLVTVSEEKLRAMAALLGV